jgi:uncharacterized protein YbaP (TraB family)
VKECGKATSWLLALIAIWLGCAATVGAAPGNGLLFEVRGKGTDPSYLFGTIHSEDPRALLLPIVFERLLNAYLARDLDKLLSLSERYLQGSDSALAERFRIAALDRRNRRMAERLRPLFEKGGYFVAVGALHLPGKEGVLDRLLDSGFSVRRVY